MSGSGPRCRCRRPLRSGLRRQEVRWRRRHHCTACGSSSARPWARPPITTALVDLGADVIKVEPPAGDYIREMTWPIVEGTSLMHLHVNRGKRSLVLDLRTEAGVAILKELAADADAVVEAMRPGSLARRGVGFDDLRDDQPQDRLLHHLGLRHDRPLPRLPQPRRGLRHLGRHRQGRHRRRGLHVHPRARRPSASTPAPLFGALGILAAVIRARATGEGSYIDIAQSDAAAAMDWYRARDAGGPTSGPSPR